MDPTAPALASIGIDIGKDVFHLVGFDTNGKIAFRRKIKRLALAEAFDRGSTYPGAHLQARQQVSSNALHPGGEHHPDAPSELGRFSFGEWLQKAAPRLHRNKLATALAQQAGEDRLERAALREAVRHPPSRGRRHLSDAPQEFATETMLERIDKRALSLMTQMVARQPIR
jgi:hypothetical protein